MKPTTTLTDKGPFQPFQPTVTSLLGRLALALSLSFALWAYVLFNESSTASYDSVPVELKALPANLLLVDQDGLERTTFPTVRVIVKTDKATLASLRQTDLRAYLDLNGCKAGEHILPVHVEAGRPGIFLTAPAVIPDFLSLRVEELITKTVPLSIEVQGDLPFSFELGEAAAYSGNEAMRQVEVWGPKSRVAQVKVAKLRANIEQLRANYVATQQPQLLDTDGKVLEGLKVKPPNVELRVPIRSVVGLKRVPILGKVIGWPSPGFVVANLQSTPPLINLLGSSSTLDALAQVETDPVDITGATTTFTREVVIRFPPGISPQTSEPEQAQVMVQIAPLVRPFQVLLPFTVQITGVAEGLVATYSPSMVANTLVGTADLLNRLKPEALVITLDLSKRGPGTYFFTPQPALPNGLAITGQVAQVKVLLQPR